MQCIFFPINKIVNLSSQTFNGHICTQVLNRLQIMHKVECKCQINRTCWLFVILMWFSEALTRGGMNQGTYTLGRILAHASILCTVMGADQNKETFPYSKVIYTSVIIRDFWTVTFEHTNLRYSAHSSLR